MQRDNFTCKCCSSKDKQLHVHHHYYKKNTLIYDYDDDCYVTLCTDCHYKIHKYMKLDWVKNDPLYIALTHICFSETDALMFIFRLHKFIKLRKVDSLKNLYKFLEIK